MEDEGVGGGGRWEVGGGRWEVEGGREKEGGRWEEGGEGRWEVEGGRWKAEGRRWMPITYPSTVGTAFRPAVSPMTRRTKMSLSFIVANSKERVTGP
jgi:hypothetical protein